MTIMFFDHDRRRMTKLPRNDHHWSSVHDGMGGDGVPQSMEAHRRFDMGMPAGVEHRTRLIAWRPSTPVCPREDERIRRAARRHRLKEGVPFLGQHYVS